jgi:predicted DNA-binding transcriptional regulator YafY
MARIHKIDQILAEPGAFLNADELADELEVSRRTLMRDIEFMIDQLGYPISTERREGKHGYHYKEDERAKWAENPLASLGRTQTRVFSLLFARKAVSQFKGTPFEEPLLEAFNRFAEDLGEERADLISAMESISFRQFAWEQLEIDDFEILHHATRKNRILKFAYRGRGSEHATLREVQPHHLTYCWNRWYLVGFDLDRNDFRTFAVTRMAEIEVKKTTFKRKRDFDIDAYLAGSFGIVTGDTAREVIIDFGASKADMIRERMWHASQKLEELEGGGVRLKMRLSSLEEVADWILGWGAHVTVRKPHRLVAIIKETAAAISRLYADGR